MTPLRIFISSTFVDLEKYREVVHSAIQKMDGHAEDMIYWSADERSPAEASIARVIASDLVILILAHRYGTIPTGQTKSVVELEYEAALGNNIPLLPFLLNSDYPWPPRFLEADAENRARLDAFKNLVSRNGVRETFTDPQSLAILVTQAIHNWERRRVGPPAPSPKAPHPVLSVSQRLTLLEQPDLDIQVGISLYGLPLVGRISRSKDIQTPLNTLANLLGKTVADPPLDHFRNVLATDAREVWCRRGITSIDADTYFLSTKTVASFSPTLMLRMLPDPGSASAAPPTATPAPGEFTRMFSMISSATPPSSMFGAVDSKKLHRGAKHIGLPLKHDGASVLQLNLDESAHFRQRQFILESVLYLDGCQFEIEEDKRDSFSVGRSVLQRGKASDFREVALAWFRRYDADEMKRLWVRFIAPRATAAKLLLSVALSVQKQHGRGVIHGDVKPHNILIGQDGLQAIDSLDLRDGQIAFGATPNWGAPEQLIQQPVSAQTDVYPLGLMLTRLMRAQLAGERMLYTLPDGFEVKVLKNPMIHNPEVLAIGGNDKWVALAKQCLSFDPNQRPSISTFYEKGKDLLARYPFPGDVVVLESRMSGLSLAKIGRIGLEVCDTVSL